MLGYGWLGEGVIRLLVDGGSLEECSGLEDGSFVPDVVYLE